MKTKAYSYIRMSTEVQLKGDSLRRQTALTEAYAMEHGLQLEDSIDGVPLRDIGVSAFRSRNSEQGALGAFIAALKDGKVPKGSVLIVESLDRLSRDKVQVALTQFLQLIDLGIEIVTLLDRQRYTSERVSEGVHLLMMSLLVMARANEESETKSRRLREVWDKKRKEASTRPMTSLCPGWLKYNQTKNTFEIVPEKAAVVRQIFTMCADVCGLWGITRHLNSSGVKPFGRAKVWHRSYVLKILRNPAVYGEFQPGTRESGKQVPLGDPVPDYYPPVVSKDIYLRANAAISRRTREDRGRKGAAFSNLFSGFAYCGGCGSKMVLRNRGKTLKGGKYLVCGGKNLGVPNCTQREWNIETVEAVLLEHLNEVSFDGLDNNPSELLEVERSIEAMQAELELVNRRIGRLVAMVADEQSPNLREQFRLKLSEDDVKSRELGDQVKALQTKKSALEEARAASSKEQLQSVLSKIQATEDGEDSYNFRSSVHQLLAKAIDRIEFQQSEVFPWELDEDSYEVSSFRASAEKRKRLPLDELLKRDKFLQHCADLASTMKVKYKMGSVRLVNYGRKNSHVTFEPLRNSKRKAELQSGNA